HFILTVLMIGVVNYTMILGHYYLVVPRLSERPLLISLKIMWIALFAKTIISIYQTYAHQEFFLEGAQIGFGYMYNWLMLTMRFLWGYVALFILSIFGYKLAKMRSIQSATGVFYIMVFFIIVGELISGYLNLSLGLKI
ncbi:hypothetical protein N9N67_10430, partial [Bacteriovoracaceae bacterium]|nr:hypothetical protein [Bacteriovoracaceae bacterium]